MKKRKIYISLEEIREREAFEKDFEEYIKAKDYPAVYYMMTQTKLYWSFPTVEKIIYEARVLCKAVYDHGEILPKEQLDKVLYQHYTKLEACIDEATKGGYANEVKMLLDFTRVLHKLLHGEIGYITFATKCRKALNESEPEVMPNAVHKEPEIDRIKKVWDEAYEQFQKKQSRKKN